MGAACRTPAGPAYLGDRCSVEHQLPTDAGYRAHSVLLADALGPRFVLGQPVHRLRPRREARTQRDRSARRSRSARSPRMPWVIALLMA